MRDVGAEELQRATRRCARPREFETGVATAQAFATHLYDLGLILREAARAPNAVTAGTGSSRHASTWCLSGWWWPVGDQAKISRNRQAQLGKVEHRDADAKVK